MNLFEVEFFDDIFSGKSDRKFQWYLIYNWNLRCLFFLKNIRRNMAIFAHSSLHINYNEDTFLTRHYKVYVKVCVVSM